jgi:transcription initiation factor IIE alpha subunit
MTNDRQEIDIEEGTVSFTPREQHHFDAAYTVFFNRRFEEVMNQLAGRDFKVLIVMLHFCEFGNDIRVSRSELARRTGIAENHISSIVRKLERLEIITVIERGARYRLNERYFWRGSAENHNQRRRETRRQLAATES